VGCRACHMGFATPMQEEQNASSSFGISPWPYR
jgi:hypothetical protein